MSIQVVVRIPLAIAETSHRRLEERIALRFRHVVVLAARCVLLLPPRSRLRNRILRDAARRAMEARNRDDTEVWLAMHAPRCSVSFPPALEALGAVPNHTSRAARIEAERKWRAEWDRYGFAPEELIVLGRDRIVIVGRVSGVGLGSGAPFDSDWACVLDVDRGQIVSERHFLDRHEAAEVAGFGQPRPGRT